ncbi:MAG: hypothetical protein RBG13Loki_3326 [Promethearchaeota archaeon CR_4]|nr:MAG: hypothetical protein RBG13Loki_3326 [Candidatus Lokiarchaeota archaeon CR_4]
MEDMSRVGTISDIFGPILSPFISVRPVSNEIIETIQKIPRGTAFFTLKTAPPFRKSHNADKNISPRKPKKQLGD